MKEEEKIENLGWRVITTVWEPPLACIVRAPSRAKARFKAWQSANDVGYRMNFADFKVKRAPEYDHAKLIPGRCYGEDFAATVIQDCHQNATKDKNP